jgi:hypothetical protein
MEVDMVFVVYAVGCCAGFLVTTMFTDGGIFLVLGTMIGGAIFGILGRSMKPIRVELSRERS